VAVSAAGVWRTEDGGATWRWGVEGLVPRYVPEEARAETTMYCVHHMERSPRPERLYLQFHGGVYRSDDEGATWRDVSRDSGLPADFGFPLVADPADPETAWVIPLVADVDRVTPEGRLRVYRTGDGGASWSPQATGLPQENAYLTVLRQAFCHDRRTPLGLYFGATSGELFASADAGAPPGARRPAGCRRCCRCARCEGTAPGRPRCGPGPRRRPPPRRVLGGAGGGALPRRRRGRGRRSGGEPACGVALPARWRRPPTR
jgi:hypothetical protein